MYKTLWLVSLAMLAFAANSLLCRMALSNTTIDPTLFTVIRLTSGAISLLLLSLLTLTGDPSKNKISTLFSALKKNASYRGGIALFLYAVCFSFAYIGMSTGSGALLLFGSVQITMIGFGFINGERFSFVQWGGFLLAFSGLIVLMLPSSVAPSIFSAALMIISGIAWGMYSIKGRQSQSALLSTSGNFVYASILCLPFSLSVVVFYPNSFTWDETGVALAMMSGVIASACGYAIWYSALPLLKATTAATVQLSVPIIATAMGWLFLAELLSIQIVIASTMTILGIYLVIKRQNQH